jgi:predicted Zn-dependent protease
MHNKKINTMTRTITLLFLITAFAIACTQNALSGKSQFTLFKESEMQSMATTQYQEFLSSNKIVSGSGNRDAEMVRRVGLRITKAVEAHYAGLGKSGELAGFKWEYNLVDSKEVNAWCMPGGKIVVYTGLLPVSQNEAALAVVLGHEVSHALLQHGNQRMSQQLGAQVVGAGLQVAVANKPAETQNAYMTAFGVGSQLGVLLPFSRKQESEADEYGLYFAAEAGYNPEEAINLWKRMEQLSNGQKPPEFLSTHPSEGKRIERLQAIMPKALALYKPVK